MNYWRESRISFFFSINFRQNGYLVNNKTVCYVCHKKILGNKSTIVYLKSGYFTKYILDLFFTKIAII